MVGGPGVKPGFAASDAAELFGYTTYPFGTRAGNPTQISSLGPKRHHALDHASLTIMWRGRRELNSDLKVRSLAPSSVGPHPHMEAAERFELSSSEVEARSIDPLCYTASLLLLVRDVGIEPTSSRLKGECISISANPANLVGDAGIEPALSRLRGECISHLCQSPMFNIKVVQDVGIEPTPRGYRPRARPSS